VSKGNFVKFHDLVSFNLEGPELLRVRDNLGVSPVQSVSGNINDGLKVRIAATHAGIITRNNGLYLPQRMRKGASTFTDDYPKPVLLHHEDHKDNVGRIIQSGYMDTSHIIKDQFKGKSIKDSKGREVGVITDALIDDFVKGKMSFMKQVDIVADLFRDSLLDDDAYEGLGHIQIVANITDSATIEKLLDGRYLTGSVGATTNRAVCSVCKADWTDEGPCEHKPGGIYDSKKCFIIAGDLSYDEYSFVNVPADRHSRVLELHYNGIQDNIEMIDEYKGRIYEVSLEFPQYDSNDEEDTQMTKGKKKKVTDSSETQPEVGKTEETQEAVVEDSVSTEVESTQETQETPVEDSAEVTSETSEGNEEVVQDASTEEPEDATEPKIEDFIAQALSAETLSDDDYEKMYDALWAEIEAALKDKVEDLETKKLDTAKRKKLAKSQFCGPNRTLPVTDEVHALGALRLLDKVELEDDLKEKITKAVNRKVKAKGWNLEDQKVTEEAEVEDDMGAARIMHMVIATLEENQYSGDKAPLADEEKNMLRSILKRLSSIVGKDAVTEAMVTEEFAISSECERALVDEVESLETTVGDLRDQLSAVRKEYNNVFQDMETLQDALADEKKKVRDFKEKHLGMLHTLRDKKTSETSFTNLTDEGLDSEVTRLTDEVDMEKIIDKLGDGMSRIPDGEPVEDPTDVRDETQERQLDADFLADVHSTYLTIRMSRGEQAAENYIERLKMEGKLPRDDK
jgi:hypothetical protein